MNKLELPSDFDVDLSLGALNISASHCPVMYREIVAAFLPLRGRSSLNYFDGTFGRGGHYSIISKVFKGIKAWAVDQDAEALEYARSHFSKEIQNKDLSIFRANFSEAFGVSELQDQTFDLMLLDLGVSSPQLDNAYRGFSFYHEGPLDMRMNQLHELTAESIINTWSEDDLIELFKKYGEIFKPYRVVRAIVHDRKSNEFKTTRQLAGLIERVDGWKQKGMHPATKYFMALRLVVNQELEVVQESLALMVGRLKPGGRLCVITFHSLEDRIVKNGFKELSNLGASVFKKVIVPSDTECSENPRSRSSKLRIFERKEDQG